MFSQKKKKKFKPMEGRTNPRAAPKMSPESQQLFDAIEDEKIDDVGRLIKAGADLTAVYETSPTCSRAPCQPLHAATVKNLPAAVDLLVAADAPLEGQDKKKRTPLHLAAALPGYEGMRAKLIEHGAALDPMNSAGVTPLYLAITEGHVENCKVLLAAGADPNSQSAKGQTALQNAVFWSQTEIALLLIEAGADVTVQDKNGKGLREKMNPKLLEALGPSLDAAEAKAKGEL
jgi:ankyrin repeat protein